MREPLIPPDFYICHLKFFFLWEVLGIKRASPRHTDSTPLKEW